MTGMAHIARSGRLPARRAWRLSEYALRTERCTTHGHLKARTTRDIADILLPAAPAARSQVVVLRTDRRPRRHAVAVRREMAMLHVIAHPRGCSEGREETL